MQSATRNVTPLFQAQTWVPHVKCPACLSSAVAVKRTMPLEDHDAARVRYHECRICGALFKSVEQIPLSIS
jgi:transcriptional regulator NrdR family protein